jgi:hypothetical protein
MNRTTSRRKEILGGMYGPIPWCVGFKEELLAVDITRGSSIQDEVLVNYREMIAT